MIDQEIKEKQEQLEKSIVAWQKQKEELAELEARKSNLVREINLQLIEAKKKADKIIAEAQAAAKVLIDEAEKIKAEAVEFSNKTRQAADDISLKAQSDMQEAQAAQAQLIKERDEFENLKIGQDMDIQDKTTRLQDTENGLNARQSCLDTLETSLNTKETGLNEKEAELKKGEDVLAKAQEQFAVDRAELDKDILTYKNNKEAVRQARLENEQILSEVKVIQDKVALDTQTNQALAAENALQSAKIAEQKKTINAQFSQIAANQRELEERETALDERTQLVVIRDREITQKIEILQELRLKSGGQ